MDHMMNKNLQNFQFIIEKILPRFSKKSQRDWSMAIFLTKDTKLEINVIAYLKKLVEIRNLPIDIPCYINENVVDDFLQLQNQFEEVPKNLEDILTKDQEWIGDYNHLDENKLGQIQLLVPIMKNPNAPVIGQVTPIFIAATKGNTEIVKILAPFTPDPNLPFHFNKSPLHCAVKNEHLEIVKILAHLTADPNPSNTNGWTPIHEAALRGNIEIANFLAPLAIKPITASAGGWTPLHHAILQENAEMIRILAPYCSNLDAKVELECHHDGKCFCKQVTPIELALMEDQKGSHQEIIDILSSL